MAHARIATVVLLALTVLPTSRVSAKPVRCDPGRFVRRGAALIVGPVAGVTPGEAIVVTAAPGARLSISPSCGPVKAKVKATKNGTNIQATWKKGACSGISGKVKLKGRIIQNCLVIQGTLKKPKQKAASFLADRATGCGDGLLDTDAGEQCEVDGDCNSGLICQRCSCAPPQQEPATTTTTTTTTSSTASTTTITNPGPGELHLAASSALEFGAVAVGDSATQAFTVSNFGPPSGNVEVTVTSDSPSFLVRPSTFFLAGGAQTNVTVVFQPQAAGHQSGVVLVASEERLPVLVHGFGGSAPGTGPTLAADTLFFRPAPGDDSGVSLVGILPGGLRFPVDNHFRACLLPEDEIAGDVCTQDSDCIGGRTCVTFSYCEGGDRAGRSCVHHSDCPGGSCPAEQTFDPTDMCGDGTGAIYLINEDSATDPDTLESRGTVARITLDPTTGARLSAEILYHPEAGSTQIACDALADGHVYVPEHHDIDNPPLDCDRDEREALVAISKATGVAQVPTGFEDIGVVAGAGMCDDFEPVADLHTNRAGTSLFATVSPTGLSRLLPPPRLDVVVNAFDQFDVHPDGSLVLVVASNLGNTGLIDIFRVSSAEGDQSLSSLTPCATFNVPNGGGSTFVSKFAVGRASTSSNDGTILATFTTLFVDPPPVSTSLIPRGTVAIDAPANTTGCSIRGLINLEQLSSDLMTF